MIFPEGTSNHLADYNFHAYITNDDLERFSDAEKVILLSNSEHKNNGYVIALDNIKGELFNKIIEYKIYDMLPWDKEYPIMLNKWEEFNKIAKSNENIYVFDCCFLQNPLCETMMRFNMKFEDINNYIVNIYKLIEELNPVVIYLKNTNIKERIQEVSKEREEKWLNEVIKYHTLQGYGKSSGYEGFHGYVECLKARQEIELSILNNLDIDKIIIENPFDDWYETHKKIKSFIYKTGEYNY
ncbi:hypothetical protein R0131_15710 [Clostridium sp. AL.422]|uniref:hypothetical protein n=1 Tax=Clostridium TaxID=1485 RepID=UPI00293DC491|nr:MULTISPECIES: hypothetical protein [unclassified Clostridium]MDV4152273.1 hypothetical protein [Clostridium sp. AL.422]